MNEVPRDRPVDAAALGRVRPGARGGGDREVGAGALDDARQGAADSLDRRADVAGGIGQVLAVGVGEADGEAPPVPASPVARSATQRPAQQAGPAALRAGALGHDEGVEIVAAADDVARIEVAAAARALPGVAVRQGGNQPDPAEGSAAVVRAQLDDGVAPAVATVPRGAEAGAAVAVKLDVGERRHPVAFGIGCVDPGAVVVGARVVAVRAAVEDGAVVLHLVEVRADARAAFLGSGEQVDHAVGAAPGTGGGVRDVPVRARRAAPVEHRLGRADHPRAGPRRPGQQDEARADGERSPQFAAIPDRGPTARSQGIKPRCLNTSIRVACRST